MTDAKIVPVVGRLIPEYATPVEAEEVARLRAVPVDVEALAIALETNNGTDPSPFDDGRCECIRCRAAAILRSQSAALAAKERECEALRKDAERLAWFLGDTVKTDFLPRYFVGVREHWTLDQWRTEIDAAIAQRAEKGK